MKLHELFEGHRSEFAANVAMSSRPQIRPEIKKIEKDGKVRLKSKKTGTTKGIFNSRREAELALANHPDRASLVIEAIIEEESDQRKVNAIRAQIEDYEKRAKATKNDIKKQHLMQMAKELRAKLPTSD